MPQKPYGQQAPKLQAWARGAKTTPKIAGLGKGRAWGYLNNVVKPDAQSANTQIAGLDKGRKLGRLGNAAKPDGQRAGLGKGRTMCPIVLMWKTFRKHMIWMVISWKMLWKMSS